MDRSRVSREERDRGDRDGRRREPEDDSYRRKEPVRDNKAGKPKLNEFWIDGEGITRTVLQSEIWKYLGPDATSRPSEMNVSQIIVDHFCEMY
jgi:hypothetical protein